MKTCPILLAAWFLALEWVSTTIVHYKDTGYQYFTVGNEAIPGVNSKYITPAMEKSLRGSFSDKATSDMTGYHIAPSQFGA
ncbi:uncharacterized protein A4U43_C06F4130 [Asparagus officinalis]|uniref:Uncharacterized protein n=1 Tax=Asparagus officinalis TaxID=4686 RepID=A0A5P1EJF2_ASPOF|nr:uncharacterized protein A4U43_C06F4130 [Asparagus officinalis]